MHRLRAVTVAVACLGIYGSGCAVAPDAGLAGKSADDLRAIRAALAVPNCAKNFMRCDGSAVPHCQLYRTEFMFPMGRMNQWKDCEPTYTRYRNRIGALNSAIAAADPPPVCRLPASLLEEYGVADNAFAALTLLSRGYALTPDCMPAMCEWYARNVQRGLAQCERVQLSSGGRDGDGPLRQGIEGGGQGDGTDESGTGVSAGAQDRAAVHRSR
jgi:hypothetical protein